MWVILFQISNSIAIWREDKTIAVLYRKKEGRRLYEIRAAGSTRRLYTDGVLHSQFNPRRLITGSVWDLLWLGLFFRPDPNPKRVLVLGLGAGTVVRQLQTLFPFVQIIAVEIDPVHIELAELHFGVDTVRAKIFQDSAETFVAGYRGPKFDLIIDDLFSGAAGIPHRAVKCSGPWLSRLEKCLMPEGFLAINFADFAELKESAVFKCLGDGSRFKSGFELRSPSTENVIAILMPESMHSVDLRRHLSETPVLSKALEKGQLRYQARRLRV